MLLMRLTPRTYLFVGTVLSYDLVLLFTKEHIGGLESLWSRRSFLELDYVILFLHVDAEGRVWSGG
jgi:hypothetical protein